MKKNKKINFFFSFLIVDTFILYKDVQYTYKHSLLLLNNTFISLIVCHIYSYWLIYNNR